MPEFITSKNPKCSVRKILRGALMKEKKCTCGERSLHRLFGANPPCAYAWALANWGREWADRNYPNHPHARKAP